VAWALAQPPDRFSIDAQCLIADLGLVGPETAAQIYADKTRLVLAGRLADGGFESKYGGGCSSVLWTADALRWLARAGERPADALRWLGGRQLADGSWLEVPHPGWRRSWYQARGAHVWITAAVLASLIHVPGPAEELAAAGRRFLRRSLTQFAAVRAAGVGEAAQIALGFDRFSLAVAVDTFSRAAEPLIAPAAIAGFLRDGQDEHGAWENSPDVTQATGHALLLLTADPWLPEIAAAKRYLQAAANPAGGWAHHQGDAPDWTLTAYTLRFLTRLASARGAVRT
jgi:hypothetical protein